MDDAELIIDRIVAIETELLRRGGQTGDVMARVTELLSRVSAIESKLSKLTTYNVTPFIPYYNEDTAQSP